MARKNISRGYRKIRGDMIESFKLISGHYDNDIAHPLSMEDRQNTPRTRGNSLRLKSKVNRQTKLIRRNFFTNRIICFWNELPDKVVTAPSIKSFERRLDRFWDKYNIKFNFEKCLTFVDQKLGGLGTINLIDNVDNVENVFNDDLDL